MQYLNLGIGLDYKSMWTILVLAKHYAKSGGEMLSWETDTKIDLGKNMNGALIVQLWVSRKSWMKRM